MVDKVNEKKFYGPLFPLIGTWEGDKGLNVSPEIDSIERSPYFETITIDPIGDVKNAGEQTLVGLNYKQIVTRKTDLKVYHHQVGYWYYDKAKDEIFYSLANPRAMCVLAQGKAKQSGARIDYHVKATDGDKNYGILESVFLTANATTRLFEMSVAIDGDTMHYNMLMDLHIYKRDFAHTDENTLKRKI